MYLEILVLAHLASAPAHGYEIKKRVERTLGSRITLNNNVLYPALRRFEESGAVVSEMVPQQSSPPHRVFTLTEAGFDVLRAMVEDFPPELAAVEEEFTVRYAYLGMLDPEVRLQILDRRRVALAAGRAHLLRMLAATEAHGENQPYAARIVEFQLAQRDTELAWLDDQRRWEEEQR